jgi:hypothetical protein
VGVGVRLGGISGIGVIGVRGIVGIGISGISVIDCGRLGWVTGVGVRLHFASIVVLVGDIGRC